MQSITIPIRVRYVDCDPMGFVHHSVYPIWFEEARTELLRRAGTAYTEIEQAGTFMVIVRLEVKYKKSAKYDDMLDVTATLAKLGGVRIEHSYEVHRGGELLCSGATTLACINRAGRLIAVPDALISKASR